MCRHVASFFKWGQAYHKNLDKQKKKSFIRNPWVDGGGVGYIPITSISLFFSFLSLKLFIFSPKSGGPTTLVTIYLYM